MQASERVLLFSYLNSTYETGIKSPLDEAILQHGTLDITGYSKIDEIPFDFERRCLSVVVQHEEERLLITKGAPESVLAFCSAYESDGACKPLDGTMASTQQVREACTGSEFAGIPCTRGSLSLAPATREL